MKIWKDVDGKWITGKEFLSRWKKGIKEVTPLQQTLLNLFGFIPLIVGMVWGIVFSLMTDQHWLTTILIGSLVISLSQLLGVYQKYLILKEVFTENENI